jgi:hypothetical protein
MSSPILRRKTLNLPDNTLGLDDNVIAVFEKRGKQLLHFGHAVVGDHQKAPACFQNIYIVRPRSLRPPGRWLTFLRFHNYAGQIPPLRYKARVPVCRRPGSGMWKSCAAPQFDFHTIPLLSHSADGMSRGNKSVGNILRRLAAIITKEPLRRLQAGAC